MKSMEPAKSVKKWVWVGVAVLACLVVVLALKRDRGRSPGAPPVTSPQLEAAIREITSMEVNVKERFGKGPWRDMIHPQVKNIYGGDAYAVGNGDYYVIHFPKVPQRDCILLMIELSKRPGVEGVGIEGHSPGWRSGHTGAETAGRDCSGEENQINVMMR
jgi:hypothetical protein